MKKTRNLFVLKGLPEDVAKVIAELNFKGTTTIHSEISVDSAIAIFSNNKSIICSSEINKIEELHPHPIYIEVTHTSEYIDAADHIDLNLGNTINQFEQIALRYNCDIGDHKSNSSGINGAPTAKDCAYCRLLNNESKLQERIVYRSKHFFVVPTLGEFIKGYMLIIPIDHVMSMAELTNSAREEFVEVLEDVEYILNLTYSANNFLVWENGTGNSGIGKAKDSIVHAHTHIAPSNLNINAIKNTSAFHFTKISLDELQKYNKNSYLLIRGEDSNTWWINNNKMLYIPRQYIRQLLAEEWKIPGNETWNWRTYPFKKLMLETSTDILTALKANWDKLPKRIQANTEPYIN